MGMVSGVLRFYPHGPAVDPQAVEAGTDRVRWVGGCNDSLRGLRCANRGRSEPNEENGEWEFRLVMTL
ncbi:MAG: hypothetical protein K9N10_02950 [Deltaproteobacteria bacterium]|nr:hypothetical protein [Deltaproteobacteria bacterium]